jgi:23S rRNA pseudouridine2605 synthase
MVDGNKRNNNSVLSKRTFSGKNQKTLSEKPVLEGVQLNKYLSSAGVCSRRNAVLFIREGIVKVNGKTVKEPGYRVKPSDAVICDGKKVSTVAEKPVYILLNKPRGVITTNADDEGRMTVIDLIKPAIKQRVFSIGRLDTNTTGLLILTNDGDLAQRLSHPRFQIRKVYHVTLDRELNPVHLEMIRKGIRLDDGLVEVDSVAVHEAKGNVVSLTLHSGKNRIIRRLFEYLGYHAKRLDRVEYASMRKSGLEVGSWRFLTKREIEALYRITEK